MFQMKTSPQLRFKVRGSFTNEAGEPELFQFTVDAPRLATSDDVRALDEAVRTAEKTSKTPISDVLAQRFTGWSGPIDEAQAPVPFTVENCRALLNMTGMGTLVYSRYVEACSAQPR